MEQHGEGEAAKRAAGTVPVTSKTLLRDLGADAQSPRWAEFAARYRPMLDAFLASKYPALAAEAEDIVQETMLALVKALPGYRYVPGEQGAFHNYLTGIVDNKAASAMRRKRAETARNGRAVGPESVPRPDDEVAAEDERIWRDAVMEIALRQLLADDAVQERTKQVFVRIAVFGENPAAVARDFGIERNAADQMKSRMTAKLRKLVSALS